MSFLLLLVLNKNQGIEKHFSLPNDLTNRQNDRGLLICSKGANRIAFHNAICRLCPNLDKNNFMERHLILINSTANPFNRFHLIAESIRKKIAHFIKQYFPC
jgi:hypothetical protein